MNSKTVWWRHQMFQLIFKYFSFKKRQWSCYQHLLFEFWLDVINQLVDVITPIYRYWFLQVRGHELILNFSGLTSQGRHLQKKYLFGLINKLYRNEDIKAVLGNPKVKNDFCNLQSLMGAIHFDRGFSNFFFETIQSGKWQMLWLDSKMILQIRLFDNCRLWLRLIFFSSLLIRLNGVILIKFYFQIYFYFPKFLKIAAFWISINFPLFDRSFSSPVSNSHER